MPLNLLAIQPRRHIVLRTYEGFFVVFARYIKFMLRSYLKEINYNLAN